MESSVEEQGQKVLEVRRVRKNKPCRTVRSCLMHKNLQFNKAERSQGGQRGGTGCEAAAISEVALTEGAFDQSRTKRNCSVLNKKTHGTATSVHWKSCRQIDFFCPIFALEAPNEVIFLPIEANESRGLSGAGSRIEDSGWF